jgi:hypothetical protein
MCPGILFLFKVPNLQDVLGSLIQQFENLIIKPINAFPASLDIVRNVHEFVFFYPLLRLGY